MGWVGMWPRRIVALSPTLFDMGKWGVVEEMAYLGLLALVLPCHLNFLGLALLLGLLHSRGFLGEYNPPPKNFSGLLFQLECLMEGMLHHLVRLGGIQVLWGCW